ncbi:MFS transporter [Streptomyces sp. NPDC001985]|uniref:MFS transporter n=1 Tax=Streptomyces sp. NPDC001985 TaxID=3154406 RepID=UPI00332EEBF7
MRRSPARETAAGPAARTAGAPGEHPAQRRILTVLAVAQMLSGAALAAGISVGALIAGEMLGSTGLAGVSSALFAAGAAVGAVGIGRVCQRWGRRPGLALGYATGALGSLGVVSATALDSVALLFGALLVYGAGTVTLLMARYAGADLASPERRGRAVSTVLFAMAAGAVAGPALAGVSGRLALSWGIPRLAGPFLLAAVAFGAAALFLAVFLRPDPLPLARAAAAGPADGSGDPGPDGAVRADRRGMFTGAAVMVLSQLVMIAVMTMTPVHMAAHGHGTGAAGLVIGVHLGAMYLSSPLSGALADRAGRLVTAALGAAALFAAGLLASLAPPDSVPVLALALVLLGVGWNLGFVAGTALITDALPAAGRAAAQGLVDVGVSVAGAAGGLASGVVVALGGFPLLALGGGILVLALLPLCALAAALPRPAGERWAGRG